MTAINSVIENQDEFVGAFRENVIRVIGSYSTSHIPCEYDEQIDRLQGEMLTLIEENAKQGSVNEDFDEQYHSIAEQIRDLKIKKLKITQENRLAETFCQRVEDMNDCLKKTSCTVGGYDEELVRRLLQSVKAISEDKIKIQFKSGILIQQRVLAMIKE